jgi:hypothetical protein
MADDTTQILEKMEQLLKVAQEIAADEEYLEELAKSCPRCGKPSKNKSNPSGRCASCLKKLASNKKKVGHYLHEHKVADDAIRRQKGKNGTAHKKSSGLGSRKSIIKQTHAAEAKAGQVLSPDRKDNAKGYSAKNVRMVPPELNRGRHHVNGKKLAAWKKRLKKTETTDEEFYTFLLSKATEIGSQDELIKALEEMSPTETSTFFDNLDVE